MKDKKPGHISDEKWKKIKQDEVFITQEFKKHGIYIKSIYDLPDDKNDLKQYVPILADIYESGEVRVLQGGLVQMIWNSNKVKGLSKRLIDWFKHAELNSDIQWHIGACLAKHAEKDDFEELKELLGEKKFGMARQMLVYAVLKTKNPKTLHVLLEATEDDDLLFQAVDALRKLGDEKAIPMLEKLDARQDLKPELKKEIQKAVKKLST